MLLILMTSYMYTFKYLVYIVLSAQGTRSFVLFPSRDKSDSLKKFLEMMTSSFLKCPFLYIIFVVMKYELNVKMLNAQVKLLNSPATLWVLQLFCIRKEKLSRV